MREKVSEYSVYCVVFCYIILMLVSLSFLGSWYIRFSPLEYGAKCSITRPLEECLKPKSVNRGYGRLVFVSSRLAASLSKT